MSNRKCLSGQICYNRIKLSIFKQLPTTCHISSLKRCLASFERNTCCIRVTMVRVSSQFVLVLKLKLKEQSGHSLPPSVFSDVFLEYGDE